jgi:polyphosphate kinase
VSSDGAVEAADLETRQRATPDALGQLDGARTAETEAAVGAPPQDSVEASDDSEPVDESESAQPAPAEAPAPFVPFTPHRLPRATRPRDVPKRCPLSHPSLYFNRELSWLDFNWRVLHQALDERMPLMERVRFAGIVESNLDEFFRKRVGGLKRQAAAGVQTLTPDGRTPQQQLGDSREAVLPMYKRLTTTWEDQLRGLIGEHAGIELLHWSDLDEKECRLLHAHFRKHIFPILTPLAVDPSRPFPFISNLSLSLAVMLRHPQADSEHFARVKVPTSRGRWVRVGRRDAYVPVEEVIAHNLHELFRGMEIVSAHAFRVTRNAEVGRDDEEVDDLIEQISEEMRERRFAPVVRLEVDAGMPERVRELLMRELFLTQSDVYECSGMLDVQSAASVARMPHPPELSFRPWEPIVPTRLRVAIADSDVSVFDVIRERDLLVHHPFESFRMSVQRFVEEAAADPDVVAIKQTLYRTSDESPIVHALMRAAENGKQVAVLVEVKARFDEENNIEWGQRLEKAGVHVTYGLMGLKTHAKVTLVIREERDRPRAYAHIGTGNYNPSTARFYTDTGLFTTRPDVTSDLINLFHYLTGYAPEQHYRRLLIAPREMRRRFVDLIRREVQRHRRNGGGGRIVAKMNALDDIEMIQELYRASQAGVEIDLIVRGHCRLRPGLPRVSENIRVRSIVGRFLEHSRIYQFGEGDEARVFHGSADWQRRNLDDRVEAIVEIEDEQARARLMRVLQFALEDRRQSWTLQPDGTYLLLTPQSAGEEVGFQERLMLRAARRSDEATRPWAARD